MKPTAVLINTPRGGIVDESALIDALRKEEITGQDVRNYDLVREPRGCLTLQVALTFAVI